MYVVYKVSVVGGHREARLDTVKGSPTLNINSTTIECKLCKTKFHSK